MTSNVFEKTCSFVFECTKFEVYVHYINMSENMSVLSKQTMIIVKILDFITTTRSENVPSLSMEWYEKHSDGSME